MAYLGNPQNTIELLKRTNFHIRKEYGQNFLIDPHVLEKVIRAAGIEKTDFVLEVGPGIGTMTQYLCESAQSVVAVEKDKNLIPILYETLKEYQNVVIVQGDILKTDIGELIRKENGGKPIKVVANLPYYITTPIVMGLLEQALPVKDITIMVQKEVADRMCAEPGGKEYGALSLAVQYYAAPEIVAKVPRNCFLPRPNVDSAVIKLSVNQEPPVQVEDETLLFRMIRASFGQRRKTLVNGLSHSASLGLSKEEIKECMASVGISENVRGEALTLEQFASLCNQIKKRNN